MPAESLRLPAHLIDPARIAAHASYLDKTTLRLMTIHQISRLFT